jgi:Ca2+-binding RTX toxin-like protein
MKKGTRRGVLLLASMLAMLVLVGGVALAANLIGNNGSNIINGTANSDKIRGLGGNDRLNGLGGADEMWGDSGNDTLLDGQTVEKSTDRLYGGKGSDSFNTDNKPNHKDIVYCGPGFDTWIADPNDRYIGGRCERVRVN